eukprot:3881699-Alexandrium_andersonii.AAC.1
MGDGSGGGAGGADEGDGWMRHDFQEPTMACDDAGTTQDPHDEAWGDVSGKKLGPGVVGQAREEELK